MRLSRGGGARSRGRLPPSDGLCSPGRRRRCRHETRRAGKRKHKKVHLDKITPKVIRLLRNSVEDAADEDGWAFMGDVGSLILKKQPNFDARNFGFEKLTPLFKSLSQFEIEQRDRTSGRFKLIYVRNK